MPDGGETLDRLSADTLGRTVGRNQLRMFGFELLELFEKLVEFFVGNLRFGFNIIEVVVMIDLSAELVDSFLDAWHVGKPFNPRRLEDSPAGLWLSSKPQGESSSPGVIGWV